MSIVDYKLERIHSISFEAFFNLIYTNKEYIQKGFAGTVKRCQTKAGSEKLFKEWVLEEKEGRYFSFFIKSSTKNSLVGLVK